MTTFTCTCIFHWHIYHAQSPLCIWSSGLQFGCPQTVWWVLHNRELRPNQLQTFPLRVPWFFFFLTVWYQQCCHAPLFNEVSSESTPGTGTWPIYSRKSNYRLPHGSHLGARVTFIHEFTHSYMKWLLLRSLRHACWNFQLDGWGGIATRLR